MLTRNQLISAYVEWLERYRWNFFGTLLFRIPEISPRRANRIFQRWVGEIDDEVGTKQFRWFRVTERGAFGDHFHYHMLVGGLKEGSSRLPWLARWDHLAGHAVLNYYRTSGGASRYIVKTARPDCDFEIDFLLPSKPSGK